MNRKHPVHWPPHEKDNRPIVIFLTVCTEKRKRILDNTSALCVLLEAWRDADAWLVGRYVLLPDHIHLSCAPVQRQIPLTKWVKYWKSLASNRWLVREQQSIWQIDFWDTQLRQGESYAQKWDYVWRNPVRYGIVTSPEDWPFSGEMNPLMWHEP
jgi:REP element-mobilizing transposase RayT